jgi:CheY-like chemotaxis protein
MALFRAQRPDLLLVDIAMPGEDGLSFLRRLRSLGATREGRRPRPRSPRAPCSRTGWSR